jgi:hypothetical protein
MVTRRSLLGFAAGAGVVTLVPGTAARAAEPTTWTRRTSANGWRIDPAAVESVRIEGSLASVTVRRGEAAAILLHIARRWHYEIDPVDTGEGGITGYTADRAIGADFESNYLSGTAIAIWPNAFPLGGGETIWPHQEVIVRDILLDTEGIVAWGGDLTPAKAGHFHLAVRPGDATLARVAARLDTTHQRASRQQTAGTVADPFSAARRDRARRVPKRR